MGIDDSYEAPENPHSHILKDQEDLNKISSLLLAKTVL